MGVVRFLAPDTDAYVASVQRHAARVRGASRAPPRRRASSAATSYFSNRIRPHLAGDEAADVFMSGPVLLWEHVGAGLVEPLDEHLAEADGDFDLADFLPRCSTPTAGPDGRATRSAPGRCWRSPSTASPTTSPTCRTS